LEAALLLKEVACVPAEGHEAREGATSATFALSASSLAVSCPLGADDQAREAEAACAAAGARVIALPHLPDAPSVLDSVTSFPYALALAIRLAHVRGIDVDRPAWADRYYAAVRSPGPNGAGG
jgi:hypothetical protein